MARDRINQLTIILIATAGGSAAALAFAPTGWQLAAPAALILLFYLAWHGARPLQAAAIGLAFGFAKFMAGLWWIFDALTGHIGMHFIGALPLTALLCLALALFPAAALAAATAASLPSGLTRLLALAAFWTLAEWLRGELFTGFPWLSLGYSQIPDGILAPWAPILGIFGVTLAIALTAALALALALLPRRRLIAALALPLLPAAAMLVNGVWQWVTPAGTLQISLLQGNIPQSLKWDPTIATRALDDYLNLTRAYEGRIVLMPETALPMRMRDLPSGYTDTLRAIADERLGAVVIGVFQQDARGTYNAAVALQKNATHAYHKTHLTPYGEYLPMATLLAPLLGAANIPYSGLTAGAQRRPIQLPDGIRMGISICYESIFGGEWRAQLPESQFLANITNDAWFDQTPMPHQHLQMAQARALEAGRWLVRAANTGITAFIDPHGKIVSRLPEKVSGGLTHEITLLRGATPYVRMGDIAVLGLTILLLAGGLLLRAYRLWHQRRRP